MEPRKIYGMDGRVLTQLPPGSFAWMARKRYQQEVDRHGYPGVRGFGLRGFYSRGCRECARLHRLVEEAEKWE